MSCAAGDTDPLRGVIARDFAILSGGSPMKSDMAIFVAGFVAAGLTTINVPLKVTKCDVDAETFDVVITLASGTRIAVQVVDLEPVP